MTAEEFKYTNYMTLEEWKKFVSNYKEQKRYDNCSIKELLEHCQNSEMSFRGLLNSIVWFNTTEGISYWSKISNRTKQIV